MIFSSVLIWIFPKHDNICSRETDNNLSVEELSEEDQQLKNELEMLVERLKVG